MNQRIKGERKDHPSNDHERSGSSHQRWYDIALVHPSQKATSNKSDAPSAEPPVSK